MRERAVQRVVSRVLLLGVPLVLLVGCQTGGGAAPTVRNFAVGDVEGYVEFVTRWRNEDRNSKTGTADTETEETILEENLFLETDGYVYHPKFMEFTLAGLFGLLQHDFDESFNGTERNSSKDGDIVEFDVSAVLLGRKPYPLRIFAQRERTVVPRPFSPSIETTHTSYGFTWRYESRKTPLTLHFKQTDVEQDPFITLGEDVAGRREETVVRFDGRYIFNDFNILSLTYNHEEVSEEPLDADYRTDDARLSHYLAFGKGRRHRLESDLIYLDQGGTFDIRRLEWRQTLRLQHSDTLRSWYQAVALDREQGGLSGERPVEECMYQLSATLEHRLYESLVTQVSGFYQDQDFDSGLEIRRGGGSVNFDYRKRNPWGLLRAVYDISFEREDNVGEATVLDVIEEPRVFQDSEPIVLNRPNIDRASIRIISADRTEVFQEGRDYRVFQVGNTTEIERVVTGRIQAGEPLLLSYSYQIGGSFRIDTWDQRFGLRQEFDFGLTPYYRWQYREQTLTPENALGVIPEDIRAHTVGVEYRQHSIRLRAEYEDYDSNIGPFEAVRLSAEYGRTLRSGATAGVGVSWSDTDYQPPGDRRTRLLRVEGRYRHQITPRLNVEGLVAFRDEDDTLTRDVEGLEVDLTLQWYIRETEVHMTYEFASYEDNFAEQDSSRLFLRIRRSF